MHRALAAVGLFGACLVACSKPLIVMQNPQTGQTVNCTSPLYFQGSVADQLRENECVQSFQRQGYLRQP